MLRDTVSECQIGHSGELNLTPVNPHENRCDSARGLIMLLVCNGMIRSGSTLQYNLVKNIVEARSLGRGEGFFGLSDIEKNRGLFIDWESDDSYHVIKMHEMYPLQNDSPNTVIIFYIYRDLRDVAVSLMQKLDMGEEKLIEMLDVAVTQSDSIMRSSNVFSQKYEAIFNNTEDGLSEISSYLGIPVDKELAESIVNKCSIDSAEKKLPQPPLSVLSKSINWILKNIGVKVVEYDKDSLLHHNHISKNRGEIGTWQENLEKHIVETINERYSMWLSSRGYK